jgi:hypothetical protein
MNNNTGLGNTAVGLFALGKNTTASNNTATGFDALTNNITGNNNTANGQAALDLNNGSNNTADGFEALFNNTTGNDNTANGHQALFNNTTGSFNIGLGFSAGTNLTTGASNIDIGNTGVAGEAKKIRIGTVGTQTATFIAGISGVAVTGAAVVVSGTGQLGVAPSSERFKEAIKPMDKASEAILALKPVTFRYKKDLDPAGIEQFGLVAEEVEKVNRDLVVRDTEGNPYSVRYDLVNAMLLNEFLKEHRAFIEEQRKVEKLEATVAQQHKDFKAALVDLKGQIQKVSAQLELSKSAPQTVVNNQ